MIAIRASPLTKIALLTLVAINGLALALLVRAGDANTVSEVPRETWRPSLSADTIMEPTTQQPRKASQQILARPVFLKSRRPYKPPPPPPRIVTKPAPKPVRTPPPPIADPDLQLAGVAISAQARRAFVKHPSNTEGTWVEEGENILGWRVSAIRPGKITLQRSGRSIDLRLYD